MTFYELPSTMISPFSGTTLVRPAIKDCSYGEGGDIATYSNKQTRELHDVSFEATKLQRRIMAERI